MSRPNSTQSFAPGALTDKDHTTPNHDGQSSEQEEETRPTHTAEIGTLKKLSVPGGTAWLGSSSGVYFVNTVRRAFSATFAAPSPDVDGKLDDDTLPASEDIITGEDASGRNVNGCVTGTGSTKSNRLSQDEDFHRRIFAAVGRPPADQNLAMDLVTTFFRQTHPLFPFLHGPKFLADMNEIYAALTGSQQPQSIQSTSNPSNRGPKLPSARRQNSTTSSTSGISVPNIGNLQTIEPLKIITFQIIINIAAHSHPASSSSISALPPSAVIHSSQALLTLILPLCTTPLLPTIQLLLSAELYLMSTISLRHASTLGGIVLRLIYHTGLHRCPLRYASLTEQDCEIRKRIFWSAYAMDRHLSLALGDPNTFQDSDIDVCLSRNGGESELHRAVARDLLSNEEKQNEMRLHFPRDGTGNVVLGDTMARDRKKSHETMIDISETTKDTQNEPQHQKIIDSTQPPARVKQLREAALTAYVQYGKLTGRIIEIFHKSINHRFPKDDAIGFLTADIENWWNDLPSTLTGDLNSSMAADDVEGFDPGLVEQHRMLTPFFTLLYHQLLLLLNRPRLSLDQASAEFQQGLQVCIRASRNTLSALKKHKENKQSMFLPGLLSAAWMSGLIIAFACQLGKYPQSRAVGDIKSCLTIIESMHIKWYTVKNCHKVLSLLLANITSRRASTTGFLAAGRSEHTSQPTRKRTMDAMSVDLSEAEPSPKRESLSGVSPASSDFKPPPVRSPASRSRVDAQRAAAINISVPSFTQQDSNMSISSVEFANQTGQAYPSFNMNNFSNPNHIGGMDQNFASQQRAGAAIYADPQDMAFAQSSHSMGLPELSSGDDQMFWGNMDSNLFDVFGAVSWETMTGPAGPMANAYDISAFANIGNGNDSVQYGGQRYTSD